VVQIFLTMKKKIVKVENYPVFIIHGREDRVVPFSHGEYLYDQVKLKNKQVRCYWVDDCGHNDIEARKSEEFHEQLLTFVNECIRFADHNNKDKDKVNEKENEIENEKENEKEDEDEYENQPKFSNPNDKDVYSDVNMVEDMEPRDPARDLQNALAYDSSPYLSDQLQDDHHASNSTT